MIYLHQISKIGSFHANHCEDYVYSGSIGTNKTLLAVFDGCTMGDECFFASILFGRILRKLAKDEYYQERFVAKNDKLETRLKHLLKKFFKEIQQLKNSLYLEKRELLSTVLIGIVDQRTQSGEFLCIGDGLLCINGQYYEFDQNNQPDYIAYHLDENFEEWFRSARQRISATGIHDVSLSTDGIFTFSEEKDNSRNNYAKALNYLLFDDSELINKQMFRKKLRRIEQEWGLVHTDDIGIVRMIIR